MIFDVWLPEFNVMLHYNANYLIDLLQARLLRPAPPDGGGE